MAPQPSPTPVADRRRPVVTFTVSTPPDADGRQCFEAEWTDYYGRSRYQLFNAVLEPYLDEAGGRFIGFARRVVLICETCRDPFDPAADGVALPAMRCGVCTSTGRRAPGGEAAPVDALTLRAAAPELRDALAACVACCPGPYEHPAFLRARVLLTRLGVSL